MTTAENQIVSATLFKPDTEAGYSKAKLNKHGSKSVNIINITTGQALYLNTPLMLTWGAQMFADEQTGRKSYDMSLQFPKPEFDNEQCQQFLNAMKNFENKIKTDAITNSKEWLNKTKLTAEVVDALFHPMLKYPKDPNTGEPDMTRAPTLRVKIDCWDDEFNCEIYDMNQTLLFPKVGDKAGPIELITKASNVALVMRCGGIWFANGKFGVTWRLVQAVVKPRDNLKGRCLIKLSTSEKDTLENQNDNEDEVSVTLADDSDTDEETPVPQPSFFEEEQKEVPKPEKKIVKKKVVRRKKVAEET